MLIFTKDSSFNHRSQIQIRPLDGWAHHLNSSFFSSSELLTSGGGTVQMDANLTRHKQTTDSGVGSWGLFPVNGADE